jgi:hypothetical protein
MLTWVISSSREEKLEPQPFHKQVCPGGTTCGDGCVKYNGGVYAGSVNGLLNVEGRELVSDGDARVERVGEGSS